MKNYLFTLLLIVWVGKITAQTLPNVSENFRIHPSPVTQTEVLVEQHPLNPNLLFATANTITFAPFFVSEGVYVSQDGGLTWNGSDTCNGAPISFHGGDPGIAINKSGRFILTRLGTDPFAGLYAHYSDDNGANWSSQLTITSDDIERASVATDASPVSPFFGRTYAAYVKLATPFAVYVVYTDDGINWSIPQRVNNPPQNCTGADVEVGRDGTVYVTWAGVTHTSPFQEILTGIATSADGGQTWSVIENAFEMRGINGQLTQKNNIRVNGLPNLGVDKTGGVRDGWIYVVTTERDLAPAGSDPDIVLRHSTDGGITWSGGIRVNQDALNNGKIQYFPALHVDDQGGVNILFYDDRNTTSDSTGVWLARSIDGGNSWTEVLVSDHNFKPVPIGGLGQGYQGDNIDIISMGNRLYPMWMDNVTGVYQIWSARIELAALTIPLTGGQIPDAHRLYQNYPNPFNPTTTISFAIFEDSDVQLQVFDISGQLVQTLVNSRLSMGFYETKWDGHNQSGQPVGSGIYLYRLSAGNVTQVRQMLLIR
jgi:hypothetical protein